MKLHFTIQLFILIIFSLQPCSSFSQKTNTPDPDFQIIDISQKQIRLVNAYKNVDSITRSKIFGDSLFTPYQSFWGGYVGEEESFVKWVNNNMLPNISKYNQRNQNVDGNKLLQQFHEVKRNITKLTGYNPKGTWYILYGPAWTNLGGLSGGTMLKDLSHRSNSSNENIMKMFPHELTHQITSNVNANNDTSAITSIINEGFAVFMNQLYWKEKYTLAENLGYNESELKNCL
jgi:hypothetical protein